MKLRIAGRGWVTPLGSNVDKVWSQLLAGAGAAAQSISSEVSDRVYPIFRVPPAATADAPTHPRLRRSSAISRFAVTAGLNALREAGVTLDRDTAARTALVFATSNGGVIYTKRFYHDIVASGAQAASPLLFPETVFNAPASHLAAILGITGATYTLVGDAAVSILALQMAADLMQNTSLEHCLVVAAEEADWLLCDAYRKWRLLRREPPVEPFGDRACGMILSEGAGALLLSRNSGVEVRAIASGTNYAKRRDAAASVGKVYDALQNGVDLVVGSANGTFIDDAELSAIRKSYNSAAIYTPKPALGEGVAAAGIWQIICAAEALRCGHVPPVLNSLIGRGIRDLPGARSAVVSVCGLNQQVAGLLLRRA